MLSELGITEKDARQHSPEWIEAALEAATISFKGRAAVQISNTYAAAAAAFHGGEAFDYMQARIDDLTAADERTPSSEAEMAQLEALGVGATMTKEEAERVH